ncbi:hypothetical protein [Rickettsia endosymbiont of Orchestes rusci]
MSKLNSNLLYNFTYFKYFSGFPPARMTPKAFLTIHATTPA